MRQSRCTAIVVLAAGMFFAATVPTHAGQRFADSSTGRQFVLGTGSGLASIIYSPVKFFYACGSTIAAGAVLAFTDGDESQTAVRLVRQGVRGDWWVHPDVFTGNRKLHFVGNPH